MVRGIVTKAMSYKRDFGVAIMAITIAGASWGGWNLYGRMNEALAVTPVLKQLLVERNQYAEMLQTFYVQWARAKQAAAQEQSAVMPDPHTHEEVNDGNATKAGD